MPERHADWLRQAKRDLAHARRSAAAGDYEWACFAAQQGAEKAVKAVYQRLGAVAWGRSVTMLLTNLPEPHRPAEMLVERAKALDKHYITTRYPNPDKPEPIRSAVWSAPGFLAHCARIRVRP
jgi:HEPN domain-containing protein